MLVLFPFAHILAGDFLDDRSPLMEHDLFGTILLCATGAAGTNGRELVEEPPTEVKAGQALEVIAQAKQRRGYQGL
jgi:hypothetical protein